MKTPPGGWTLFTQVAIAVLVTICLSIWQIGRGIEKLEQKEAFDTRLQEQPISEAEWGAQTQDFQKISLLGRLDSDRTFIIENQSHQGRPGFWIFGVLNTERDRYLINRGWVPAKASIRLEPDVPMTNELLTITGVVWPNDILRNSQSPANPAWPIRMREVDIGLMARLTASRAQELRLVKGSGAVLEPAPLQIEYATAIHWGYAFQWLLIGALVVGGYWFFTIRKERDSGSRAD